MGKYKPTWVSASGLGSQMPFCFLNDSSAGFYFSSKGKKKRY
jgi:hypothetical protein